jgi:hypothetical protein|tara:strand:+ start:74 stop:331 length:258 start_codon:yes stop_codon:yes gene_type:complete
MKWLLVDKNDNINSTCKLHSGYGEKGAKMYFMGRKQLEDEKEFDTLWKVMSEQTYDAFRRESSSSSNSNSEWWKDKDNYIDIDRP